MRTARMMLAGMLTLAMSTVPATVAAQVDDAEPPVSPAHWTGDEVAEPSFSVTGGSGYESFPWGYRTTLGVAATARSDDPRAAGDLEIVFTLDWSEGLNLGRGTGLARLVNEGGSFEGPVNVVYYPDGTEFRMAIMEGKDGYEGLTYSMTNVIDPIDGGLSQGLIWEGDVPPLPDAQLLPD